MTEQADNVAKICFEFYQKNLVTKSKPKENEWTNLAAILQKSKSNLHYNLQSNFFYDLV